MTNPSTDIVQLSEMQPGNEADLFVLLSNKESLKTQEGKPYYRVTFRDNRREMRIPIWSDAAFYDECHKNWAVGEFYKVRGILHQTQKFGLQLEIRKIRPVRESDKRDGFHPNRCRPSSRHEPSVMFDEILALAKQHIITAGPKLSNEVHERHGKLFNLITMLFKDHRKALLDAAAAKRHHHIYFGGLLEHMLSVTKIAIAIADHYRTEFHDDPDRRGVLCKSLVVAGAILHDIGKIREQHSDHSKIEYTLEGSLIGHVVLGRDFVRDYAQKVGLDDRTRTQLEHIILSHQRLAEWGSPKPPMSLEAVIVHHADSCDALIGCHFTVMEQDDTEGPITSRRNVLGYPIYKNI